MTYCFIIPCRQTEISVNMYYAVFVLLFCEIAQCFLYERRRQKVLKWLTDNYYPERIHLSTFLPQRFVSKLQRSLSQIYILQQHGLKHPRLNYCHEDKGMLRWTGSLWLYPSVSAFRIDSHVASVLFSLCTVCQYYILAPLYFGVIE